MAITGPLISPPRPPANLTADGKKEWNLVCRYLVDRGLLHSADLSMVETHVAAVMRLRRIEQALERVELLQVDSQSSLLPDQVLALDKTAERLLIQANQVSSQIAKSTTNLCLNPNARTRLTEDVRKNPAMRTDDGGWSEKLKRVK